MTAVVVVYSHASNYSSLQINTILPFMTMVVSVSTLTLYMPELLPCGLIIVSPACGKVNSGLCSHYCMPVVKTRNGVTLP